MPTKKTSTTLLNTSKRKACLPDGPTNGHCRGSSTISGAGTTLRINLLFFRKTTPAKTR
ncbi:glycoside hydrolase family 5 protein, partial [Laccaria amethystina LaAM-08-1]